MNNRETWTSRYFCSIRNNCFGFYRMITSYNVFAFQLHVFSSILLLRYLLASFSYTFVVDFRRQERATAIQSEQLPVDDTRQTVHLHDADEARRRLEPNTVQRRRLHETRLRNQLRRNPQGSGARELQDKAGVLLRQTLFRGRVTGGVQVVPAHTEQDEDSRDDAVTELVFVWTNKVI